ncbi:MULTISPECIES: carboxylic acid reductase [unclassified Mycolicibacterium]|uniref:carboxylic acid reductase n=1 Tax=unclassified Mycolicibacterium TaxID=2636767 RepID=UPI0012DF0A52|nr:MULTISPECIES: carboxylic acid reductase [unclassified Mycolicibacterium]MUL84344.1 carboxylic acid reductase [Mycolicibacterium sp. CBMA 329]MUL88119.1 carboxylic acid reductase [Mycolicibacterium sp. CBMA 331]MUM02492.1 carboxylic acid reductase [Mycolicibacterium sp. CBMA 334]MUM26034.1 carboxylic acid reductase [Mycolicibacterium sp. CBMA 295]MUM39766.1 carboxylic acid reductase [Mycolicibacterium sp. CBMA 247]
MPFESRDEQLASRIADLTATDPQFAAAIPSDTVTSAVDVPGLLLPEIVQTVLQGYAERPALGERALDFVVDPATGRTTARLLPRFDTISYGQLWDRVRALGAALHESGVAAGDRVAILGFTSADYTVIDIALGQIGAVSVPLQTSSSPDSLAPIVAETQPRVFAASVDHLADAVELALTSHAPANILVFDHHPEVDDHRDVVASATERLAAAGGTVALDTLADLVDRGNKLPAPPTPKADDTDPLALLIYTSGSTGTPKGAMYLQSAVGKFWRRNSKAWLGPVSSAINLSFMPMSHVMGRGILYASLAAGGTCYFAARSDLSTLLEDLALARPTELNFVPRVWEMIHSEFQSRVDHRLADAGQNRETVEAEVLAEVRDQVLGGRFVAAMTGSAPISAELKAWTQDMLGIHLLEGYGSTEAGMALFDGVVQHPPVIDYKLVDVPDLGYFSTDQPYPRGELLIKTENLFPGYYKRPEVTASVFDEDGFYRTGDVVAEIGPDQLQYVDRRNNVLKLAQGEFVTLAKLEAVFGNSPLVQQIYVYGNSAQPYLLAVVVPTDAGVSREAISESLQEVAREADLQSYEIPRDFIVETTPFSLENGLLTGIRKLAWPKLKAHYGDRLEQLYADLAETQANELRALRNGAADAPVVDTVSRAAGALLGAAASDLGPDAHFTDLGGDSLSALTFGNLLRDIFDVDVPVGVIVSPATDLAGIAAYIETQRNGSKRPTYASVHGRHAAEVSASDLTLDKFLDADTLAAAPSLPKAGTEVRTVLLTGATGFLGRYLALEWLERMDLVDGKVICLVRAKSDEEARARLDATFDSGDAKLLAHYQDLAADHLEVIAGDKGEENLGLDRQTWQRLADDVDLIVDPAALVNHVLPYSELFGPNALGTAELIRIALTTKIKPFTYVSTIGVGDQIEPGKFVEDVDVRQMSAVRKINDGYANGYGNSKWAGEVLLREANDLCGLPVAVFRCDMILADTTYSGQLNVPDMFTRMMFSLVATGIAPGSFYELGADGKRQRSHYDGLPVEFIAESISTLGAQSVESFETYHVMNPYDDGLGLDEFTDWLIEAGYPIERIADYGQWIQRFESTLRALPDKQRQASLLPLLHNYQQPERPMLGALAPTDQFRAAVQEAKIGPDKDIPHVSAEIIVKYITDLQQLGLL